MGMAGRVWERGAAALLALGLVLAALAAPAAPPLGFSNDLILAGLNQPVDLSFLPDGRLLVLEKGGQIWIADPEGSPPSAEPYLQITDIESNGERGLLAIALHPDFESNGHFFLYYSRNSTTRLRVSRFTHLGDVGDPGSELMVWEDVEEFEACCHYGGGLVFGADGNLYLTLGEEFEGFQSQDLTRAGGKIHRFAPDGSIPPGNPFADGPGGNVDSIWAFGLRNPFRATFDPPTGRILIADVGGNDQATAREEVNVAKSAADYGWPSCEGPCGDPGVEDPIFSYPHNGDGASITGGFVYRGTAFDPSFDGAYFFGDFVRGFIHYLTFDGNGNVTGEFDFEDEAGPVVALEEGPDGALYYADIFFGHVRRISFDFANQRPQITASSADPVVGEPPLAVSFSGSATDAEGDPLTFTWFFGDGEQATGANVGHVYTAKGPYDAVLRVSDGTTPVFSAPIRIQVGTPPTPTIVSPANESLFRAGETLQYSATASDDGPLDPNDFRWTVTFRHNEHIHPAQSGEIGSSGQLLVETSGHDFSDDTRFEIRVDVTDSDGLVGSDSIIVRPEKIDLSVDTLPSGLTVQLDGISRSTPFVHDTLIDFEHTVSAPLEQCLQDELQQFDGWSDGGAATHVFSVPDSDASLVASYLGAGECPQRVPGAVALYDFREGSGATVLDRSGAGTPIDLSIGNPGGVSWLPGGGLAVEVPTTIASIAPASRLRSAMQASGELTLEAWVRPFNTSQGGPARIVTYSLDGFPGGGNFLLGQEFDFDTGLPHYAARLRTTATNQYGKPDLRTPGSSVTTALTHVLYTRDTGGVTSLYLDGQLAASGSRPGGFSSWGDYELALAGEPDDASSRFWLGELHLVAIYDFALDASEVDENFRARLAPPPATLPPSIDQHPQPRSVVEGQAASFSVAASGSPPLAYQWQRDGSPVPGATGSSYTLSSPQLADDGAMFRAVVSNAAGSATSAEAELSVTPAPQNDPPTPQPDAYSVDEGDVLVRDAASGVLANDSDPDGDPLEALLVSGPAAGNLSLSLDGSFSYTHDGSEGSGDSFVYQARDPLGEATSATVSLTVNPVNDAPLAVDDGYNLSPGDTLVVDAATGVLVNDSDAEGDPLTAVKLTDPSHGGLAFSPNGAFTYSHGGGGQPTDSFQYRVDDPSGPGPTATVTLVLSTRTTAGLQALYRFGAGGGDTVADESGLAPALDLGIADPAAVSWLPGGGLSVDSPTALVTAGPATRLRSAMQASGELSIEAWLKPANLTQTGPARVVAYSQNGFPDGGNFVLGQVADPPAGIGPHYDARLRSTLTDKYGRPSLATASGSLAAQLSHVVFTRDASGATRIYLDGQLAASGATAGSFSGWVDSPLALANEPTSGAGRAWLGELYLVALFDRALTPAEVDQNFQAGP